MPSLMRFLTICGLCAAVFYGSMFVLAKYFEPTPRHIAKTVRNLQVR
jgi:hypothetical protein